MSFGRLTLGNGFSKLSSLGSAGKVRNSLFGVNMSGAEFAALTWPSSADWVYLASKGIGFARLLIAWENMQKTLGGSIDATNLASLKTAIASAHANGIKVIVDLHNAGGYANASVWGSTVSYAGNGGVLASGVNFLGDGTLTGANLADFWTKLTTALVGTAGLVGYGVMNEPQNIINTNLITCPNGFGNLISTNAWFYSNAPVVTQLAPGTNPIAGYGPAWSMTSGSGFASIQQQNLTLAAIPYTLSFYVKQDVGAAQVSLTVDFSFETFTNVTSSWQRVSFTFTPTAGSHTVGIAINNAAGSSAQIANVQLEAGSSASTYQPSQYWPYAQQGINAIRAVDATTSIYVCGLQFSTAYEWPWTNWEFTALTGGGLIPEAHQYFDGTVAGGTGGGGYAETFSAYGITTSAGVQEVTPWVNWLTATSLKGFLGEIGVPNSTADNNPQWLVLQNLVWAYLRQNGVPATMYDYGNNGGGQGGVLDFAPVGGVDDIRLTQMLAN